VTRAVTARFRGVVVGMTAALAGWVAACGALPHEPTATSPTRGPASTTPAGPVVADVGDLFAGGPLFGVTMPDRSESAMAEVSAKVGCRPALLQLFASVGKGISAATLRGVPGIPVLSVEPWQTGRGKHQPDWTLAATIEGHWDEQYTALARAVVEYRDPVLIRYAHEMNGHWYPWGTENGNEPGQYVAAWRHVVDLFRDAGATNALWVWSPNILRGASSRTLKEFWPGPTYVDVVGLTGYGVRERSPAVTYRATLKLVYALTDKPILLTEVGVQPGAGKRAWLRAFGPWLKDNPHIAGFVWNEITRDDDWRYDDTESNLAAFKAGLSAAGLRC
jgi:hypothetical protein